jgi:hypothetical protein
VETWKFKAYRLSIDGLRKVYSDPEIRKICKRSSTNFLKHARSLINRGDNPMKILMRMLMPTLLICLLAAAAVVSAQDNPPKPVSAQSDAKKAFEKLKSLAGSWEGTLMGMPAQITIRVTSSGNAILHEGKMTGMPDNPITMLYVEGDRLLLTHYCDSGNRPRMQGKLSPDGKTVTFDFLDVSGNSERFLMHDGVFTMIDADHHIEEWTFIVGGKPPVRGRAEFQRTK